MVYKSCFMAPYLDFGSIKLRCLKFTNKKTISFVLFVLLTGYYTGSVNSPLGTSIKTGLCLLSSYYIVKNRACIQQLHHFHCWLCSDMVFLLQRIWSVTCTIIPFLFKFMKHDHWVNALICQSSCLCTGQNDSTS